MSSIQEIQRDEERTTAAAALLEQHFVDDPELLTLVRRHRDWLARTFAAELGYRLIVTEEVGRLVKRFDVGQARDLPLPPRSASHARQPIDERAPLDGGRIRIVCLICSVLERLASDQMPLRELAEQVAQEGRELDLPDIDYTVRAARDALADAVAWLASFGILRLRAGQAGVFGDGAGEEAFYDVDRRRLALLMADPIATVTADDLGQIVEEVPYPPTAAGDLAQLRHRAMRALVEDPIVYRHDPERPGLPYTLAEEVDAAYGDRRANWDRTAASLAGLDREARLEGTALVVGGRELTDRPFPTNSHPKQLALLLLPRLCALAPPPHRTLPARPLAIALDEVRRTIAELCREHAAYWKGWDARDPAQVAERTDEALRLLGELGLVWVDGSQVHLLAAAHRYSGASAASPQTRLPS